jgi:hypothetical protein
MAFDSSDTDPTAQRWPTTPPLHGPPSLPSRTSHLPTPIIAAPSDSQTRMIALFPTRISNSHDLHRATLGVAEIQPGFPRLWHYTACGSRPGCLHCVVALYFPVSFNSALHNWERMKVARGICDKRPDITASAGLGGTCYLLLATCIVLFVVTSSQALALPIARVTSYACAEIHHPALL